MTDARKLLEDYHSYSSGADSAAGARLHMTTAALLAVLDECDRYTEWPTAVIRNAIDTALGVTDERHRVHRPIRGDLSRLLAVHRGGARPHLGRRPPGHPCVVPLSGAEADTCLHSLLSGHVGDREVRL